MEESGGFQGLWIPREIWLLPMGIVQKNLLAELVAHQQGMGVARITVNKITTPLRLWMSSQMRQ